MSYGIFYLIRTFLKIKSLLGFGSSTNSKKNAMPSRHFFGLMIPKQSTCFVCYSAAIEDRKLKFSVKVSLVPYMLFGASLLMDVVILVSNLTTLDIFLRI